MSKKSLPLQTELDIRKNPYLIKVYNKGDKSSDYGKESYCLYDESLEDWLTLSFDADTGIIYGVPKITAQPKAASVKAGKTATFKVKASGGALHYQWYYQKKGTSKWVKMSGKTAATLKVKAKKALNGYKYRCLVKNSAGKVYTKAVKLTVK